MDDGNSWIGILLFAASVAVFYLIYGFGAAIQALNTSALEDERDEGNKKAAALLRIQGSLSAPTRWSPAFSHWRWEPLPCRRQRDTSGDFWQ